jgi:hypothetical protein
MVTRRDGWETVPEMPWKRVTDPNTPLPLPGILRFGRRYVRLVPQDADYHQASKAEALADLIEQQHKALVRQVFISWFLGFLAFTLFVALLAR